MTTFARRMFGAARLNPQIYEEVEADHRATLQAAVVVLLASLSGGIGLVGLGAPTSQVLVWDTVGAFVGWLSWAALTYLIGTQMLAEPQTRADLGELLRTLAFSSAPGVLRIFGVIPHVGLAIYLIASLWMLVAMVVAVRQALDYRSTGRAVAVCVVGWVLSLAMAAFIGNFFARSVS
jgi:hypothetical protein